jgi:RNA-directed DNA polymerase
MTRNDLIFALAKLLRASEEDIKKLILTAPYQYKHYKIKKRTGGYRDIYHPTAALKAVQRWLISNCFPHLMIHPSVFSYREGVGIRQHASQHLHSNFLLRIDFKDFFPSIDQSWVLDFFYQEVNAGRLPIQLETVPTLARLVCRFAKEEKTMALSIGAPSSPLLSNAILFTLDQTMDGYCRAHDCVYTRYADDIYISTKQPDVLSSVKDVLGSKLKELTPKLNINDK